MDEQERHDLGNHSFLATTTKTILSLNLGVLVRTALGGFSQGRQ